MSVMTKHWVHTFDIVHTSSRDEVPKEF